MSLRSCDSVGFLLRFLFDDIGSMGYSLQNFCDKLDIAIKQVNGYVRILKKDAQRRQSWFDNAIKIVSVVIGLDTAS